MENNVGKVEYKMESWKRTGIFICFIVWIGTFIVGRHMEESSVYKVLKAAAQNVGLVNV